MRKREAAGANFEISLRAGDAEPTTLLLSFGGLIGVEIKDFA